MYVSRFDVRFRDYTQHPFVLWKHSEIYTKPRDVVYNSAEYTQHGETIHKGEFLLI